MLVMLQRTHLSAFLFAVTVIKVVLSQLTKSRVVQVGEIIQFVCPHPTDLLYHRPPRSGVMNYTLVPSAANSTRDLEGPLWRADVTEEAVTWTMASGGRSDAGNYRCADEAEEKIGAKWQIIVIEAPPTCQALIEDWQEKVDCDSQSESNITLTCAIAFSGDASPVMIWRESGRRGNIAPSYYEENNSTATSHLVAPSGKRFTCIVSFSSLESQFSYTCQPMDAHPCGSGGIQSLTDSYLVLIVTSIVIISISICLCIFYVITFVCINWRSPGGNTKKSEKLTDVPIIDLNGGDDDNASDVDDGTDAPTTEEVGESSQATSV